MWWHSSSEFIHWLTLTLYWIVLPVGLGIVLLPFTPYAVKKYQNKSKKPLPSLMPFWGIIIPLVLLVNWLWGTFFNGHLYYEWDTMFIAYSLVSYEHPQIDGVIKNPQIASRMMHGLSIWHLYFLWLLITLGIYCLATGFSLWKYRTHKNFQEYKKILYISIGIMTLVSIVITPLVVFLITLFTKSISSFSLIFLGQ